MRFPPSPPHCRRSSLTSSQGGGMVSKNCFHFRRAPSVQRIYGQRAPTNARRQAEHHPVHVYDVRPRNDKRGVDLVSDALPFGRLWYAEPNAISNAIGYAKFYSRSHDAVIRVYDSAGNVIETHEHI